ncbi:MAG: hypothetical protein GX800_12650 [Clostridiaceae bacterium]|nr:hypothetical protein [Clostridiaceae bacterium]
MAKKTVLAVLILFSLCSVTIFAETLEQAVATVAKKLFIETKVDKNILRYYNDWGFIDKSYIDVFAGALHSGLLAPDGRMLNPKGNDLSPLYRGLVRFSMKTPTFELIGFSGAEQREFTPDTIFITDGEIASEFTPDTSAYYYALVNKGDRTYVVWKATAQKPLWLYRGTLYLKEGNEYIIKNPQKKSFGQWKDISENGYITTVLADGVEPYFNDAVVQQEIKLTYLDRQVFIVGQLYDGKIKSYSFEIN